MDSWLQLTLGPFGECGGNFWQDLWSSFLRVCPMDPTIMKLNCLTWTRQIGSTQWKTRRPLQKSAVHLWFQLPLANLGLLTMAVDIPHPMPLCLQMLQNLIMLGQHLALRRGLGIHWSSSCILKLPPLILQKTYISRDPYIYIPIYLSI